MKSFAGGIGEKGKCFNGLVFRGLEQCDYLNKDGTCFSYLQ